MRLTDLEMENSPSPHTQSSLSGPVVTLRKSILLILQAISRDVLKWKVAKVTSELAQFSNTVRYLAYYS